MKCRVCGSAMEPVVTNLPFKINTTTIVILKDLPVTQCNNWSQYFLDDPVMERVEEILKNVDTAAELEVIRYVA